MIEKQFSDQIEHGERFQFGKNWNSYLKNLSEDKIIIAEKSLTSMMSINNLKNKSFLDIGCGSGLFSLAAKRLGGHINSIDFDPHSVKCAKYLKEKFYNNSNDWKIEQGSVLDIEYMKSLTKCDIVYSWGVLHHTGKMSLALENAIIPLKLNGLLFIAIYNDQGWKSQFWLKVKQIYNSSIIGKAIVIAVFYTLFGSLGLLIDLLKFKNPIKRYRDYKRKRGMSKIHDWKDWLGGLPFEVATPEYIFDFYKKRGFKLENLKTDNSLGCNQYVFRKTI
jgi:2-polyprenyl-6-hydroxyphenyl methylase/3-demethylubiquinone-9 3-methyltransferase